MASRDCTCRFRSASSAQRGQRSRALCAFGPAQETMAMDAMDALDAVGERNVQLVRQVGPDQWDDSTPCTEWNVRMLVGHLTTGRHVYRGLLECAPVEELRSIMQRQDEASGDDP